MTPLTRADPLARRPVRRPLTRILLSVEHDGVLETAQHVGGAPEQRQRASHLRVCYLCAS